MRNVTNITLLNCQVTEKLYESDNSLVYRGHRPPNNQSVILKIIKQAYPPPEKIAQFKREYELTRNLALAGVVQVYSLENNNNRPVMILEDFGGQSLAQLNLAGNLPITDFLGLAITLINILSKIHQKYIIHKDINPSNILYNPTTQQVKIIDFGISTLLTRENPNFCHPNLLEGTLAYISPEQTGRMNRTLDYRTDFYSLGATFYELLTGQLPFPVDEALELVHCHIAKQPTPPHELKPDIPQMVSEIVLKLMAKNAEDRYQSARGLIADLEKCLQQWQAKQRIDPFPLAQSDISDRFQIPQKLYGRAAETQTLIAAIERVISRGGTEMMLVSGYSGIGKSALVQEVYKPLTRGRGYFISGKFDQFQRNIPYASIIQAFRSLVLQLLTETEAQLADWREKLLAALGPNGQVMIEIIPELELIVGPQPAVPELLPTEAQNRFNLVFQNFIKVFTQREHPLVIFLDDLQWADGASLKLLEVLMTAADSTYLFLIGAYRDNEVTSAHPLRLTLDEIEKAKATVHQILLSPLSLPHVTEFIADLLHVTAATALPLAELVHSKTGGNPFFVTEFLKSLYAEGLLNFDYQQGFWKWDLRPIQGQQITENVVELMAGKIQKLPLQSQAALKIAACIGNQFDLETLAIASEKSPRETAADLWKPIAEGFILPTSDAYKLIELDVEGLSARLSASYKFAHDRVQQAVYSLIPETEKQSVHLRVGQLLLRNAPSEELEHKIFDIVNQLNLGRTLIIQQTEQNDLALLNLQAGKKAKASVAYQPAFNYLQVGIALLGNERWLQQYDLTLKLHIEASETAYILGKFEEMQSLIDEVLQQAKTQLDTVKIYEVWILAHVAQKQLMKAMQISLEILKLLGIEFPEIPSESDFMLALQEINVALAEKQIEDLVDLPEMKEPDKVAAMGILSILTSIAYKVAPQLLPLCVFKQISLSLNYGNAPESTFAYACYGLILCSILGNIDSGYAFGQLALSVLSRLNSKKLKAATLDVVNAAVRPWKEPIKNTLKSFLEGYQSGLETGVLEFTAYCAFTYCTHSYFIGKELSVLEREMAKYSEAIRSLGQQIIVKNNETFRQAVLNLMGQNANPLQLIGEGINEETFLPEILATNDRSSIYYVQINKLMLCYWFESYSSALETSARAEEYLDGTVGMQQLPLFYFYDSLTRLAVFGNATSSEQEAILARVRANQEKIQTWAQHAPMNHLHKYYLVEAERDRVLGNYKDAREHYDRAISLARENEFLNEEALSCELAGKFYLFRNQPHVARHYLQDAHYVYQTWGAVAKVKDLETRYPQFVTATATAKSGSIKTTASTDSSSGEALDLTTVVRASQAIAGEILLDKLLGKLMNLVIENAGAQKGYLILSDSGTLKIEAEGSIDNPIQLLQSLPVASTDKLPSAIINYVARTLENVVLSDATREGMFAADAYIIQNQPKSILCAPIVNQGKLTGILYLENNIATGAFTRDRLEVVRILSAQAAISIENALLYRTLEQKVEERTAQLAEANREITVLNERLKAENIRMAAELDVTRQLQQMILPKERELSQISALDIAGFMEPADEVGGDYYDVLQYADKVKIGIGDVTGHGLESGMLMIMAQTAARALMAGGETDPIKFLNVVNRTLFDNVNRMNSDKNMSLAFLDYSDGILRLSGQHEEALVARSSTEIERIDTMDLGFPIGLEEDIADFVTSIEVPLKKGDVVVLYSDGITEAENMAGEQYGIERLMAALGAHWQLSAKEIKQAIILDVRSFIGEQKVYDDITLVVLKQK